MHCNVDASDSSGSVSLVELTGERESGDWGIMTSCRDCIACDRLYKESTYTASVNRQHYACGRPRLVCETEDEAGGKLAPRAKSSGVRRAEAADGRKTHRTTHIPLADQTTPSPSRSFGACTSVKSTTEESQHDRFDRPDAPRATDETRRDAPPPSAAPRRQSRAARSSRQPGGTTESLPPPQTRRRAPRALRGHAVSPQL